MIKKLDTELIHICEGDTRYYGASQYWFKKKIHGLSGCGPATAALILRYMAEKFSDTCGALYEHEMPAAKEDFVNFMQDVREFVKPGIGGLTDHRFFASSTIAYAQSRGVKLRMQSVSASLSAGVAFGFITRAISEGYMPALLIMRNPSKALDEFTWHWMGITGYDDEKKTIYISTYGEEYELVFEDVWNQNKPYRANCVYFYPE
ncbi:MAG: hypothetical protein HN948_03220 [Clostridia bacterium]|jgi:hypothetical protein|nr:hypothetical protein [Clostridia bacterium]MBT7122004.1 hypothetical protein [Clostridia bacterium]